MYLSYSTQKVMTLEKILGRKGRDLKGYMTREPLY